jgi:hypothetical protein
MPQSAQFAVPVSLDGAIQSIARIVAESRASFAIRKLCYEWGQELQVPN